MTRISEIESVMPTSYRIRGSRSKQGLQRFPTFSLFFISFFFIFISRNSKEVDPNPIKVRSGYPLDSPGRNT